MLKVRTKNNANEFLNHLNRVMKEALGTGWELDSEGDYKPYYSDKGWMRPKVVNDRTVKFCYVQRKDREVTNYSYSSFHCNLAEVILRFLDEEVDNLSISPMLTKEDFYKIQNKVQ